jgi:hypothetical protein
VFTINNAYELYEYILDLWMEITSKTLKGEKENDKDFHARRIFHDKPFHTFSCEKYLPNPNVLPGNFYARSLCSPRSRTQLRVGARQVYELSKLA